MIRVYRRIEEIGPEAHGCAVSVGNFDGVHIGHKRIFRRVVQLSRERGWKPSVLTFDPHPTKVVAPGRAPKLLSSVDERVRYMQAEGIEQAFVLPFDERFSRQTPEEFVEHVLVERLQAKAVLVGDNFRFGNKQAGNVETLRELGAKLGFIVEIIGGVELRGRVVSSSAVRAAISAGQTMLACRLLERPYALEGNVVRGQGIGSKQTVPTLNLETAAEVLPANGVYVSRTLALSDGRSWPSVTNVGYRPTFNGQGLTIETFLLEKLDGDSPENIRVEFYLRLRDEKKFESPEALRHQILRDVSRAQAFHRRYGRLKHTPCDKIVIS